MSKHTPEPWKVSTGGNEIEVYYTPDGVVAQDIARLYISDLGLANASRIVACVNALAGKDPAVVEEMAELLVRYSGYVEVEHDIEDANDIRVLEDAKAILERMEG